jgi:hypothetical protein
MNDRPKALRFGDALAAVEQQVVDALPEIIDGLIARAKGGDTKAAVYLCDRIMGRAVGSKEAPADDRELPYSEEAFLLAHAEGGPEENRLRIVISYRDDPPTHFVEDARPS